jgi:hypothetical protein
MYRVFVLMVFLLFFALGNAQVLYDVTGRRIPEGETLSDGIYFQRGVNEQTTRVVVLNGKTYRPTLPSVEEVLYEFEVALDVDKEGWVYTGLPFPKGKFRNNMNLSIRREGGLVSSQHENVLYWGDGSVKLARVLFHADAVGEFLIVPNRRRQAVAIPRSTIDPFDVFSLSVNGNYFIPSMAIYKEGSEAVFGESDIRIGDILTTIYTQWNRDGSTRTFLMVTNKIPCQIKQQWPGGSEWQPGCAQYGGPTDRVVNLAIYSLCSARLKLRYAEEIGKAPSAPGYNLMDGVGQLGTLRPGESRAWEITTVQDAQPPLAMASADYYSSSGVFDIVPHSPIASQIRVGYEANMVAGINHIFADRTSRSWWANSRDWGEDYRDWDTPGGGEYWGTHNDEYETNYGYLLQALRTSGTTLASKAFKLSEAGAQHHAVVDVNAVSVDEIHPNIRWVAGSNWQHTDHGGRGLEDAHRNREFSPHLSHASGRACMWMWCLTGNPLMMEGFQRIVENVYWRIENHAGYADLDGEARIAAHALALVLDGYEADLNRVRANYAIREIVEQQSTRSFLVDHTSAKAKPWMCSLFVVQMLRARDLMYEFGELELVSLMEEKYPIWATFLSEYCINTMPDGTKSMYHKVNPFSGGQSDMWDLVGADALAEWNPELARALFQSGGDHPWYPGHPTGVYSTLLSHAVLNTYGHRAMRILGL